MECETLVNRLKARDAINSKEVREAFLSVVFAEYKEE